jgi:pyruvate/2-oxoglutarate dehydrogenase complex dihydrolipoamide dehydrogenase (E3) component
MLAGKSDFIVKNKGAHIPDMYFDPENIKMFDNVRPRNWVDPERTDFDIVVIGGGAAGMVTSAATAMLGAKAALIERGFIGGDCLVTGCVPSKAFLKAANVAHTARTASEYGVIIEGEVRVDFPKVMERVRKIRAEISKGDSAERFAKYYGAHIFMGQGEFTGPNKISVNGKELSFKKAVIATGARAFVPNIPGLKDVKYYTNDNIFNLTQ